MKSKLKKGQMPSPHAFHSYHCLLFRYSCGSKHPPQVYRKLSSSICGGFSGSIPCLSTDTTENHSPTHSSRAQPKSVSDPFLINSIVGLEPAERAGLLWLRGAVASTEVSRWSKAAEMSSTGWQIRHKTLRDPHSFGLATGFFNSLKLEPAAIHQLDYAQCFVGASWGVFSSL